MPVLSCTAIGRNDPGPRRSTPRSVGEWRTRVRLAAVLAAVLLSALAVPTTASAEESTTTVTVEETVTAPGQDPTTTTTTTTTTTESPDTVEDSSGIGASVCGAARALLSSGRPADALALIDAARRTSDGADAATTAAAAVVCPQTRAAALTAVSVGPSGPAGDVGRGWATFTRTWLEPLIPAVLVGLAWLLLVFLVVVRVLSVFPVLGGRLRSDERQVGMAWWSVALSVAAVGLLLVSLALGRGGGSEWISPAITALAAVLLAVAAVLAAAHVTGRLRIAVSATDKTETPDLSGARTTQLVALLGQVGGSPPAGVERPRGSDVTSLDDSSLLPAPVATIAKAVVAVLAALVGGSPWKVSLDYSSDSAAAITVSRNGRTVQTAELSSTSGLLDDWFFESGGTETKRILLAAQAAGVVIVALSRMHPGFDGLSGATDGRSVGLQFVATTTFAQDRRRASILLALALQIDPGNRAADVALQHLLHRRATSAGELTAYRDSLSERARALAAEPGFRLLEQRVLMTYFAVLVNLRSAVPGIDAPPGLGEHMARMRTLLKEAVEIDRTSEQDPLLLATRSRYKKLKRAVLREYGLTSAPRPCRDGGRTTPEGSWSPLDPYGAYNSALTVLSGDPGADARGDTAARAAFRLEPALLDVELRRWIRQDPEVTRYRGRSLFDRIVASDSGEKLWDIPLFTPFRPRLESRGITTPLALTTATGSKQLASDPGIDESRVALLTATAVLLERIMTLDPPALSPPSGPRRPDLRYWRVDLAEIVLDRGIVRGDAASVAIVGAALRGRMPAAGAVTDGEVRAWLATVLPQAPAAPTPARPPAAERLRLSIDLRRR